jgi:hypothetical protein
MMAIHRSPGTLLSYDALRILFLFPLLAIIFLFQNIVIPRAYS